MQVLFTENDNDIIGAFFFKCRSQAFVLVPQLDIGACFGNVGSKAKSIALNQEEQLVSKDKPTRESEYLETDDNFENVSSYKTLSQTELPVNNHETLSHVKIKKVSIKILVLSMLKIYQDEKNSNYSLANKHHSLLSIELFIDIIWFSLRCCTGKNLDKKVGEMFIW